MIINVKRLMEEAIMPTYATDGSGCFDLYATDNYCVTQAEPGVIGTGLSFEVPKDHVMLIFSRSGHGFKHNVRLANCVGVIDSDYRGEVAVKLTCDSTGNTISGVAGDRIAQGMIIPHPKVTFQEVRNLSITKRGEGGFGSTG